MGLRKVGWIFTDLVPSATTANKVKCDDASAEDSHNDLTVRPNEMHFMPIVHDLQYDHHAFTRCDISEEWTPTSSQLR